MCLSPFDCIRLHPEPFLCQDLRRFDPVHPHMRGSACCGNRGERALDSRLEQLFSSLDASFNAALDRSEEEAATDLAFSLIQDRSERDHLRHAGFSVRSAGGTLPIVRLGEDFVETADGWLFRLGQAVVVRDETAAPPLERPESLIEVLRHGSRRGADVQAETPSRYYRGRLVRCGPDHVCLRSGPKQILIPLGLVSAFRFSHGD